MTRSFTLRPLTWRQHNRQTSVSKYKTNCMKKVHDLSGKKSGTKNHFLLTKDQESDIKTNIILKQCSKEC